MTIETITLIINFIISISLYAYFMIDEHRSYAIINRISNYLSQYEKNLCTIFIVTTYYWMVSTVLWLIE